MSDQTEGEPVDLTPPASAVDEVVRKKRETARKRRQREDREFFHLVAASEAGRRFLWSILSEAHTFETRFAAGPGGSPDVQATFFHLGEQQLGQRLYQTWHIREPELTMTMLRENDSRFASGLV